MQDQFITYLISMFVVQFMIYLIARGLLSFILYWIFKIVETFNFKAFLTIYNTIMQVGNIILSVLLAAFMTGKNANLGVANLLSGAVLGICIFLDSYIAAYAVSKKLKNGD